MKIEPVLKEEFHHDGRGPELQLVHYSKDGSSILAIDYFNPEDKYVPENLKHLLLHKAQVFMFTPEEVYGFVKEINWGKTEKAAVLCLGQSKWLKSFNPMHLGKCKHYRVMFYDEYLDIICEGIEGKLGGYKG